MNTQKLTKEALAEWQAFMQMQETLTSKLEQNLVARSGLSAADYTILVVLTEETEPMRMVDLGGAIGWEKSRLHHQITRMVKRGLVERRASSDLGGRAVEITYTEDGREAIAAAAPAHTRDVKKWVIDVLTPVQLQQIGEISRTILENLDE